MIYIQIFYTQNVQLCPNVIIWKYFKCMFFYTAPFRIKSLFLEFSVVLTLFWRSRVESQTDKYKSLYIRKRPVQLQLWKSTFSSLMTFRNEPLNHFIQRFKIKPLNTEITPVQISETSCFQLCSLLPGCATQWHHTEITSQIFKSHGSENYSLSEVTTSWELNSE